MYVDEPPKDGNIPDFNISKIDICPFRAYQRSFRLFQSDFSTDIHQRSRLLCFTQNDHTGQTGFKICPFLKWAQKLIVAEEQPRSKLPNEEVVSGKPEMLLTMKEETKDIITPSSMVNLYRQGCDDFYRNQASHRKEQLDKIMEYLHYTMAPFIKQDDMETFCAEIMSFAINPAYEPKPLVGLKGTLTSFDVRHLIWNITSRLGLGKGKPYSVELCINFIRTMFPDLCKDLDNSTLKNLRVTSTSDKIHIDLPGKDGVSFHIPQSIK